MIISWDDLDPRGFAYEDNEKIIEYKEKKNHVLIILRYYAYICQGSIEDYFVTKRKHEPNLFFRKGFLIRN